MKINPDWLVPQWSAPPGVRALCTTRLGGQSRPPYSALNLGDHVGDDSLAVAENRAILRQAIAARPVFLSQVHSVQVQPLVLDTPDGAQADACLTDQRALACTIMVADCLPVLLTNAKGSVVAAAHAGWRSLAGQSGRGVIEHLIERFWALAPVDATQSATEIIAWMGPCIGPDAFEVGGDVRQAFVANDTQARALFKPLPGDKWLADLPGLARLRLARLGVRDVFGNDGSLAWCTVSQPSRFFSHRRDGVSGRMAACIWLA